MIFDPVIFDLDVFDTTRVNRSSSYLVDAKNSIINIAKNSIVVVSTPRGA